MLHRGERALCGAARRAVSVAAAAAVVSLGACVGEKKPAPADIPEINVQVERYDVVESRYLATGDFAALQQMNTGYPVQTRLLIEDILKIGYVNDPRINVKFINYYRDSVLQDILREVSVQYADMSDIDAELSAAFSRLKQLIPAIDIPLVYAQVGALDQSIVITDGMVGVCLDKYLGAKYTPYIAYYPAVQRVTMERSMIVPDCMMFYLLSVYPGRHDKDDSRIHEIHVAKVQWLVNQIVGKKVFTGVTVTDVDKYMRRHPKIGAEKLLTTDIQM